MSVCVAVCLSKSAWCVCVCVCVCVCMRGAKGGGGSICMHSCMCVYNSVLPHASIAYRYAARCEDGSDAAER